MKDFGQISQPLTNMLKKDRFQWSDKAVQAFENLKKVLMKAPVLALPDFSKEFVVECDASGLGIGAVLSQEGHPIAFLSKAFSSKAPSLISL